MTVVVVSELSNCAGLPLSSCNTAATFPQVPDHEAMHHDFIPADGCSALLISPRRILTTGGSLTDDRVLPFTVLRYLDLDTGPNAAHKWVKPLLLRPVSKKGKRKRGIDGGTIPVCRIDHTLTLVPEVAQLFLIGGMKVGGKDEGTSCKSIFSFDINTRLWECVQINQVTTRGKQHVLGPCLAHVAVYMPTLRSESRPKKASGFIVVHGGYVSATDVAPSSQLHIFDVRMRKWILRNPERGITAPQRAYHAAAATESCRHLVVHGGSCSDINDPTFMSSDLFVFDMVKSQWFRPKLLQNSHPPPLARSRHCIVNGIGTHQGSFVMYGGIVGGGETSCDMFVLTIIEPISDQHHVSARWDKIDIMTPERPLPQGQSPSQSPQAQLNDPYSPAISGGCLVPVPAIHKYIVIGGRGPYGIRNAPLVIDAYETENLDRLQPLETRSVRHSHIDNTPPSKDPERPPTKAPPPSKQVKARLRIRPPKPARLTAGLVSERAKDKASGPPKRQRSRPHIPPSPSRPTPPNPVTWPQLSSIQQSLRDDFLSPAPVLVAGKKARARAGGQSYDHCTQNQILGNPGTKVLPKSAVNIQKDNPVSDSSDIIVNLIDDDGNDNDVLLPKKNHIPNGTNAQDMYTPPTKRKRFMQGARNESPPGRFDDSDKTDMPNSAGSDFVAASELAKRAISRTGKSSRGRGRVHGRGRGTGKARAAVVAEEREVMKAREIEEALNRENVRIAKEVTAENIELRVAKEALKKDNLELNEQMKSLLSEVQSLRVSKRPPGIANGTLEGYGRGGSATNHRPLSDVGSVLFLSQELPQPGQSDVQERRELKALRSKISDLQEECQETNAELDGVRKSLKVMEVSKRALENEFNAFKNKSERIDIERDQLRKQASELRTALTAANAAQETTSDHIRKSERATFMLRRELENTQQALRHAESNMIEERLQLSSAQRLVSNAKGQLTVANKKYEEFHSKERRLQIEVDSQRGKVSEMKKCVEEAKDAKDKFEEKNIELIAELESLKIDFSKKCKDCSAALKEAERSRQGMDRERKKYAELDINATRLRRDLERSEKECNSLTRLILKREKTLRSLIPSLSHITKVVGEMSEKSKGDDFDCEIMGIPVANAEVAADIVDDREQPYDKTENGGKGVKNRIPSEDVEHSVQDRSAKCATRRESQEGTEGSANRIQRKEYGNGDEGRSPIPPSDDTHEP